MPESTLQGLGFQPGRSISEQAQQLGVSAETVGRAAGVRADVRLRPQDLAKTFSYNSTGPGLVANSDPSGKSREIGSDGRAREQVTRAMEPTIPFGGFGGYMRAQWMRKLDEASKDIGVNLTLEKVDSRWWLLYGTSYRVNATGTQDAVDRFAGWWARQHVVDSRP